VNATSVPMTAQPKFGSQRIGAWWRRFLSVKKNKTTNVRKGLIVNRIRVEALWLALFVAFAIVSVSAIGIGAYVIPSAAVVEIVFQPLLAPLGLSFGIDVNDQQTAVLWSIRMPRVLLGAAVGAGLAVTGTLLQGLFRNPLADPGLIGVTTGAALAAACVIVLGGAGSAGMAHYLGGALLPLASFLGGGVVVVLVHRLATREGVTSVTAMLLAGIAMTAFAGAGIGVLIYVASDIQNRELSFWTLGSLARSNWHVVSLVVPCVVFALIAGRLLAPQLNALVLGETEANYLGINTQRVKILVLIVALIAVGASVAFCGNIGFVGLVAPHCIRLLVGPDHRTLIPASALLGAILTIGADLVARTMVAPAELPIGILTSLLGVPFFLLLLRRQNASWSNA
jgi:iron complex transport system permease protein